MTRWNGKVAWRSSALPSANDNDLQTPVVAMDPSNMIMWAVSVGFAWLLFASITGADDWLKSLVGKSRTRNFEERVKNLEKRLDEISKK